MKIKLPGHQRCLDCNPELSRRYRKHMKRGNYKSRFRIRDRRRLQKE